MARKDTLGKLKMPEKPMAESEAEMDLGMEAGEEEMPMEDEVMPEGEMMMDEEGLAIYSDEELLEELKLRGLSGEEMPEDEMMEDEDLEELPLEDEDEL